MDNEELLRQLTRAFLQEAEQQLCQIQEILSLETDDESRQQRSVISDLYRQIHNLKGSARTTGFSSVEALCNSMEAILSDLRGNGRQLDDNLKTLLRRACEAVQLLLPQGRLAQLTGEQIELLEALQKIATAADAQQLKKTEAPTPPRRHTQQGSKPANAVSEVSACEGTTTFVEGVSIIVDRKLVETKSQECLVEDLIGKVDELLALKALARQQSSDIARLLEIVTDWSQKWNDILPKVKQLHSLGTTSDHRQLGFLQQQGNKQARDSVFESIEQNKVILDLIKQQASGLHKSADEFVMSACNSVDAVFEQSKQLMLSPCLNSIQLAVSQSRELARTMNKPARFIIQGAQLLADRRILTKVEQTLIVLLRSIVVRLLSEEKTELEPETLTLRLLQIDEQTAQIRASVDRPYSAAVLSELLKDMSLQKATNEIFKFGGKFSFSPSDEASTTALLEFPLSVGIYRGVLIEVSNKVFVLPTANVERVIRTRRDELRSVEGLQTILVQNTLVPVCELRQILHLSSAHQANALSNYITICILCNAEKRVGFVVDEVVDEQEMHIKGLGRVLEGTPNVSGVTILGTGRVVPVLNPADLINDSARSMQWDDGLSSTPGQSQLDVEPGASDERVKKILVVDDTLTARILLRNILESAGLQVRTANDGREGLRLLKSEEFDLVITDIEMPSMNGFELTEEVRKDEALQELPVVMVTSLTSKGDRERGVAAGANAYFVKSSFDDANLLEVVNSLICMRT